MGLNSLKQQSQNSKMARIKIGQHGVIVIRFLEYEYQKLTMQSATHRQQRLKVFSSLANSIGNSHKYFVIQRSLTY
ncbi:hypothetical protein FGO68_gene17074 [Halteria grandinella]|uniref:Uncharacterized protein n=1 Tax=Halteria grandinella TaxID=5974 RepID=A0A8J8T209_HALGN|nr:hypothetical protein FGO68_gene17074 [Halteria grandinella]